MKKVSVSAMVVLAFLFAGPSCRLVGRGIQGSGVRKTEKRDFAPFKSVDAAGAYDVTITCQQAQSFEIEGDDNILPIIQTEVRDGVLHIHNESAYNSTKGIAIRIAVPDLEKFSSEGAGDVHVSAVKNERLVLISTGAANLVAAGQTKFVDIGTSGAGNVDTVKLSAERANIMVSGAANVDVYASQQLDVSLSGIGSVTYSGNPPVVNKSVSGIGSVNKKE
jgi:hypothetical protein